MKVLIIEDEPLAAEKLIRYLKKIIEDIEIIASTTSVKDSLEVLNTAKPDLILSDIHLSDGLSFQIFEESGTDIPIIFTTAYDQYAIKAFKANSIDYLLKPIGKTALQEAIDKFQRIHQKQIDTPIDFKELISSFAPKEVEYKTRFLVQSSASQVKSISVDEIAYFFADGKYTYLVTFEGARHFSDLNISHLQDQLDPKYFFQINRKYIIHIDSIDRMITYSASRLKVELKPPTDSEIIVSVDRSPHFKKWLGK